jgi:hypothetical protein
VYSVSSVASHLSTQHTTHFSVPKGSPGARAESAASHTEAQSGEAGFAQEGLRVQSGQTATAGREGEQGRGI